MCPVAVTNSSLVTAGTATGPELDRWRCRGTSETGPGVTPTSNYGAGEAAGRIGGRRRAEALRKLPGRLALCQVGEGRLRDADARRENERGGPPLFSPP